MAFTIAVTTDLEFDDAVEATRTALGEVGFGVLTEIDLAATLKEKIGAQIPPYLILGACRPPLAEAAVRADPSVGALLPCNVVVRREGTHTVVEAMDPGVITQLSGQSVLAEVAADAQQRLTQALQTVAAR